MIIECFTHRFVNSTNGPYKCIWCWIWLKSGSEWKTESQMEWLNFLEKLYSTIVDLFCRYNSDNNMNTTYIDCLQRCLWSLVRKIYLEVWQEQYPCLPSSLESAMYYLLWLRAAYARPDDWYVQRGWFWVQSLISFLHLSFKSIIASNWYIGDVHVIITFVSAKQVYNGKVKLLIEPFRFPFHSGF